jgi:hypothetical protein
MEGKMKAKRMKDGKEERKMEKNKGGPKNGGKKKYLFYRDSARTIGDSEL